MSKKVMMIVMVMCLLLGGCGTAKQKFSEFEWPNSEIAKLLPIPESNIGKIEWETSDGFVIYVGETIKEDFDAYVNNCKEKGFTVDYHSGDGFYYADNSDGYNLSLILEEDDTMRISLQQPTDSDEKNESNQTDSVSTNEPNQTDETLTDNKKNNGASTDKKSKKAAKKDEIGSEFKEAMDSYEAFFDEYCSFMKKYNKAKDVSELLVEYSDYMTQYAEMMEKMEAIDEDKLSTAELAYYTKVSARITKKLAKVTQ